MAPAPKNPLDSKQPPGIVFQPRTARAFQAGARAIVAAIRPSLGPFPRAVVVSREPASRSPEFLDSGGIIARRIISLADRDQDAGAMYLRGALWNLHERLGDGVATAAVIFQAIFDAGLKYVAAGGNAMRLRHSLEQGGELVGAALDGMAQPAAGREILTGVAATVCHDAPLAETLGNLVDLLGEEGLLHIRAGRRRSIEQELLAGSFWTSGLFSPAMINRPAEGRAVFEDARLLISDLDIQDPQELVPLIRAAVEGGIGRLVLMCASLSEPAQNLVLQSRSSSRLQIIAVRTPGVGSDLQLTGMADLAVLTGGRAFVKAAGDTLAGARAADFGRARRIWANAEYTGLAHPQGDPLAVRRHLDGLRAACRNAETLAARQQFQERIGRVLGGSATVDVGGLTEAEMETRRELARRTLNTLRGALRDGLLPGGGTALLACRPALARLPAGDESFAARRILSAALEAPFRTLMRNAGRPEGESLARVEQAGAGFGFDLLTGQVRAMIPAGILDVAAVQKQAFVSAVRAAALALTIDVIVHRVHPPVVTEPDAPGR